MTQTVSLYVGEELGRYDFGHDHPFGPRRQSAFWDTARESSLDAWVRLCNPIQASQRVIELFHTPKYVSLVRERSEAGHGYLDYGDTPAFKGIYEIATFVVGSVLHAVQQVMERQTRRAFIPIAGLHHARPERAAGFCVFNDLGVAIAALKHDYGLSRIAYVDIDAHHGDGIYYPFEADPAVIFADTHEDGRFLYPGTGHANEQGKGAATGIKLNLPLQPGTQDEDFFAIWPSIEKLLRTQRPEFILLQGGVDSLAGDPLTHLGFSPRVHAFVTNRLITIAEDLCDGRLIVTGGGGYNLSNIARGWTAILRSLLEIDLS
ncbi:acetoin utilization protein AcuC [Gammaproteobacteria bacterium]